MAIPTFPLRPALVAALVLAGQAASAQAPAPAPASSGPWTNTGNVSLVSDYVFRGVSQTQGKPTGQATLDFAHSTGAYVGLFGSGVSHAAYNNGSGSELDLYAGYRHVLDPDSNIDAGVVTYWYPAARYSADGHDVRYHTQDFKIGFNRGSFNAYGWLTLSTNWFGFGVDPASGKYADSRGTTYVEANWNPELASGLSLNLHVGRQDVKNFNGYNFYDFKIGMSKTWESWFLSGSAVHNNGDASKGSLAYWRFFNADGTSKNVVGTRLVISAGRNF